MLGRGQANQLWPQGKNESARSQETGTCKGDAEGSRGLRQAWRTPGNWFSPNLKQRLVQTPGAIPRPFNCASLWACHPTARDLLQGCRPGAGQGCPSEQCWKDRTMGTVQGSTAGVLEP